MDNSELIKAFGAFFAILNPFSVLPVFMTLTAGFNVNQQRLVAVKTVIYSAIMCAVILIAGQQIIAFFGITVDQFRIAGGIVLAHIAWQMLNGGEIASHHGSSDERTGMQDLSGMAFYPITFPMVVGPGTIATIIIYGAHATTFEDNMEIAAIIGAVLVILFAVLYFASSFGKEFSATMRVITARLMGMILLAIAVEMVIAGATAVFPGLAGHVVAKS